MLTRTEILTAAHSPYRCVYLRDLMKTDLPTISPNADLFAKGDSVLQDSDLKTVPVVEEGKLAIEVLGNAHLIRASPRM